MRKWPQPCGARGRRHWSIPWASATHLGYGSTCLRRMALCAVGKSGPAATCRDAPCPLEAHTRAHSDCSPTEMSVRKRPPSVRQVVGGNGPVSGTRRLARRASLASPLPFTGSRRGVWIARRRSCPLAYPPSPQPAFHSAHATLASMSSRANSTRTCTTRRTPFWTPSAPRSAPPWRSVRQIFCRPPLLFSLCRLLDAHRDAAFQLAEMKKTKNTEDKDRLMSLLQSLKDKVGGASWLARPFLFRPR